MSSDGHIVPRVSLLELEIDPELFSLVPQKVLHKHRMVPIKRKGATITVATSDPSNIFALDELRFVTGYQIETVLARLDEIDAILDGRHVPKVPEKKAAPVKKASIDAMDFDFTNEDESRFENTVDSSFDDEALLDVDEFNALVSGAIDDVEVIDEDDGDEDGTYGSNVEAPIIKLVNGILIKAIKMGVSDIHVEPFEKLVRVRYRVDGVLKKVMTLPAKIKAPIISRLKIMSHLDISEKRLPQDGRIKLKLGRGREMDFRVSSLPCMYGEKVVLRLLDKSNLQLDMTLLGFEDHSLEKFKWAIYQPWGMVLVTGPTGSGKTTTLYSALSEMNKEETNIVTAEDPIEYNLNGINQVQMIDAVGLNFASALRSFLRQDPDIIMVGEIRDFETAEISIKAALTGHLVLSTLHTNDAPSTVNRLVNMGIEPFLVSSSVNLILAQRLARKVCSQCKVPAEKSKALLEQLGMLSAEIATVQPMKGSGCEICGDSGYKGRVALYEVLKVDADIREQILMGATAMELQEAAVRNGMDTLRMAGIKKLKAGLISVDEVIRCTKAD